MCDGQVLDVEKRYDCRDDADCQHGNGSAGSQCTAFAGYFVLHVDRLFLWKGLSARVRMGIPVLSGPAYSLDLVNRD
jgi:hypothetical protein